MQYTYYKRYPGRFPVQRRQGDFLLSYPHPRLSYMHHSVDAHGEVAGDPHAYFSWIGLSA